MSTNRQPNDRDDQRETEREPKLEELTEGQLSAVVGGAGGDDYQNAHVPAP
jgi:hypothetical protein